MTTPRPLRLTRAGLQRASIGSSWNEGRGPITDYECELADSKVTILGHFWEEQYKDGVWRAVVSASQEVQIDSDEETQIISSWDEFCNIPDSVYLRNTSAYEIESIHQVAENFCEGHEVFEDQYQEVFDTVEFVKEFTLEEWEIMGKEMDA